MLENDMCSLSRSIAQGTKEFSPLLHLDWGTLILQPEGSEGGDLCSLILTWPCGGPADLRSVTLPAAFTV